MRPSIRFSPARAGNGRASRAAHGVSRFSPARAGNGSARLCQRRCGGRFSPARAGNRRARAQADCRCGSAPRVRGTGISTPADSSQRRFSPARAGNRRSVDEPTRSRMRFSPARAGNGASGVCIAVAGCGSAPRVRGTEAVVRRETVASRFSPARAGNGMQSRRVNRQRRFSPARAGNDGQSARLRRRLRFSPARAGNGVRRCRPSPTARFSPARAGNRYALLCARFASPVQPRACGERAYGARRSSWHRGSAPRVRGTVRSCALIWRSCRFIPARAGNRPECRLCAAVYAGSAPRVRGTATSVHDRALPCGSAPRVRGTGVRVRPSSRHGSAPRVRGTGDDDARRWQRSPVQPRACGEQAAHSCGAASARFSPARAGNSDTHACLEVRCRRFSPARAGNRDRHAQASDAPTVQPRACGEQRKRRSGRVLRDRRFSPARAGNSAISGRRSRPRAVQPRACGEQASGRCRSWPRTVQPRACGEQRRPE